MVQRFWVHCRTWFPFHSTADPVWHLVTGRVVAGIADPHIQEVVRVRKDGLPAGDDHIVVARHHRLQALGLGMLLIVTLTFGKIFKRALQVFGYLLGNICIIC